MCPEQDVKLLFFLQENEMKATDLDVETVTLYVLNEKVFDLDSCPDWAQYAAVNEDGTACWFSDKPDLLDDYWAAPYPGTRCEKILEEAFYAYDWEYTLVQRPNKSAE